MADKKVINTEQQKRELAEQLWLSYFNQTLYEKGIISETERNRMQNMICRHKSSTKQSNIG